MARTDSLTNFLTDVSTAIKTKKGDDTPIKASDFDTEIANLPSGGGDTSEYNAVYDTTQTGKIGVNITKVKVWDTKGRTNFNEIFYGLTKLTEVPMLDTSDGTTFTNLYYNCEKVTSFPTLNTSKGTTFSGMYYGCKGASTFPTIDTSNGTLFREMYKNCSKMQVAPALNTSNGTNFNNMFSSCSSLTTVPTLDLGSAINVAGIIYSSVLTDLGGFKDLGKAYLTTQSANYSNYTLNLSSCAKLTEQSLINVLNNLYDIASLGVQTQKCTLGSTNLAKLTSEAGQQALANAQTKGWTVA